MKTTRLLRSAAAILAAALTTSAAASAQRMVRIPAGTYRPLYGTGAPTTVAAFMIDRDPVTRAEFPASSVAEARRPMTEVTWAEAGAYCKARGGRLPTLAEWEYVAAASAARKNAAGDPEFIQHLTTLYATRSARSTNVGAAEVNAYGVRGLHDLVWEWVADPNEGIGAHHHHGAKAHDMSCAGAAIGAADPRDYPAFLRSALRSGLTETTRLSSLGFRCAA
jgi:sulfatase modifying factor 1